MATTENNYTGDGSLQTFSFTFPYLEETDIRVSLDGSDTSAYILANATTIQFNTAPANGVAVRIYRVTDQTAPPATFFAGSSIRAQDLNDNFLQALYVAQETDAIARNLTAGDIAPGSITGLQLADDAVTSAKLATNSVGTDALYSDSSEVNDSSRPVITDSIRNSAVTEAKIATDAVTEAKIADDAVTADKLSGKTFVSYAIINDTKASYADGGTFTDGDWRTRDLNTEVSDPDGIVTISSNQFTLGAGSYLIIWNAPAYNVNTHQSRLYDVTNTTAVQVGSSEYDGVNNVSNRSFGSARVTITASTTYEIQHRCSRTAATFGFGVGISGGANWGDAVYTIVEIYKEAG